ncbi:tweety [Arctopsyche grandis]|uniref:tweety n=1 Tax=Arctopsyche grandis TaxID=121162 RepID=UPI00406D739D
MAPPPDEEYRPPVLARLLHALPHVNVTLHRVNSSFAPHSELYLESLGILGSVPAAWLILTLLVLLIYLLTRCCDRKPRPSKSISALKVTLCIVAVLCCGAIGMGLYGNDDLHNALLQALDAARSINNIVGAIRNQTNSIELALTQKVKPQLTDLSDIFDSPVTNQTALGVLLNTLSAVRNNTTMAVSAAADIKRPLAGINMDQSLERCRRWEWIRWIGAIGAWSALVVACAVLLIGVARHSRRALIAFSVCALAALVACWLAAGAALAAAVALADACQDPAAALAQRAPPDLPQEVVRYYLVCEVARANPFTQRLRESQRAVLAVRQGLTSLDRIASSMFNNPNLQPTIKSLTAETNAAERVLNSLTALVDCRAVRAHYLAGARALCDAGLLGLALLLLASALAGLLFTILVWVDSHTWIYIRKKRDYAGDEHAPFLPPSSSSGGGTLLASASAGSRTLPRSQGSYYPSVSPRASPPLPPSYGSAVAMTTMPSAPLHSLHRNEASGQYGVGGGRGGGGGPGGGGGGRGSHLPGAGAGACHTLGRLPSHAPTMLGPNNGKYATLSKQCKTLESSDFY